MLNVIFCERKVRRYQRGLKYIKSRKSMDRQHNVWKKNDKRISNGLQDITQKTKDRATRT